MPKLKTKIPLDRPKPLADFKVKRFVTLPLWKWEDGVTKYFRSDGAMHISKVLSTRGKTKGNMEPATLMSVTNLENGLPCQIIVGAMLKGCLEDEYPKEAYVGKSFSATQTDIGKRYKGYAVAELDV